MLEAKADDTISFLLEVEPMPKFWPQDQSDLKALTYLLRRYDLFTRAWRVAV